MRFVTFWPPLWLRRVVLLQSSRSCNPSICEQFQRRSTITDDNARVDIRANGFWGERFETAFFDVRVFNALAASSRSTSLAACYRNHESMKCNHYEEQIRCMEHSSFTLLVFSIFGGAGPLATVALKNLAACLAEKKGDLLQPHSELASHSTGFLSSTICPDGLERVQILPVPSCEGHHTSPC